MKNIDQGGVTRVVIDPGEYYVTNKREIISTLLGSCVSACLYDPVSRVIGMNHFLLAYQSQTLRPELESEEGRYGLYAMELLINSMMKLGAVKSRLQAKCFGGGNVLLVRTGGGKAQTVGDVNVEFIKAFLNKENIPIVAADLGGNAGRNIHFVAEDFAVYVKPITMNMKQHIVEEERRYWKKNIELQQQEKQSKVDYW